MKRKAKTNRDGSVTITLNGRNNAAFWTAVEREAMEWENQGYVLTYIEKGGNYFKDGILTSLLNLIRPLLGKDAIHDPQVKMTFSK